MSKACGEPVESISVEVGRQPGLSLGFNGLVVGESRSLRLTTPEAPGFVDLTSYAEDFILESGVQFGLLVGFSRHTTAALVRRLEHGYTDAIPPGE